MHSTTPQIIYVFRLHIMMCQAVWNTQKTTDGNTVGVRYNFLQHIFID